MSKASVCGCPAGQTASGESCVGPQQPSGTGGVGGEGVGAEGGEEIKKVQEDTTKPPRIEKILEDVSNKSATVVSGTVAETALGLVIVVLLVAIIFYLKKTGKLDEIITLLREKFDEIFHREPEGEKQPPVQRR